MSNFFISGRANSLESQEVAETGSLIINRAKSLKLNNTQNAVPYSTDKPSYEIRRPRPATTPTYGLKQSIYVPTIPPIESTTQKRTTAYVTTPISSTTEVTKSMQKMLFIITEFFWQVPTTTFEPTTFIDLEPRNDSHEKEALEGSHSSWFNTPTTQAPVTETVCTFSRHSFLFHKLIVSDKSFIAAAAAAANKF